MIFGNWKQLQKLIQFSDDLSRLGIRIVSNLPIFAALYLISSFTSFEFFQSMAQLYKLPLLRTFIKRQSTKGWKFSSLPRTKVWIVVFALGIHL